MCQNTKLRVYGARIITCREVTLTDTGRIDWWLTNQKHNTVQTVYIITVMYCHLLDNTCQITHAFYLSPSNSPAQDIIWILSVCLLDYLQWLCTLTLSTFRNWPLARYVKLRVVHAPTMPGTFSPPRRVSDPGMDHGTRVTHVPCYMPRSLTSGYLWSRWRG